MFSPVPVAQSGHGQPSMLNDVFLDLLLAKKPEVMLVLTYHGVLMHWCRHLWVYGNVGALLVKSITTHLDPERWNKRMA